MHVDTDERVASEVAGLSDAEAGCGLVLRVSRSTEIGSRARSDGSAAVFHQSLCLPDAQRLPNLVKTTAFFDNSWIVDASGIFGRSRERLNRLIHLIPARASYRRVSSFLGSTGYFRR